MKHLKSFNESVKQHLKPRSEEEIKSELDKLPDIKKLLKIREHNLYHLFSDDEIKKIKDGFKDNINKIIELYSAQYYNTDFFKKFIEKFPDYESFQNVFEDYSHSSHDWMDYEDENQEPEVNPEFEEYFLDEQFGEHPEYYVWVEFYNDLFSSGW